MAARAPFRPRVFLGTHAFTLLEVALIVAIIGMMLMILVGYLFAPKPMGPLPPVAATTPIPSSVPAPSSPAPASPVPIVIPALGPLSSPTGGAAPAAATPAPPPTTPAPAIEISPAPPLPAFR